MSKKVDLAPKNRPGTPWGRPGPPQAGSRVSAEVLGRKGLDSVQRAA